jgi:hypothetical protein
MSHREIADMLGCSKETVRRRARQFGYPERIAPNRKRETPPKPHREGVRQVELARVGTYSGNAHTQVVTLPCEPWENPTVPEPISEEVLRKEWQASVLEYLFQGFGVEDIAVKLWCDVVDVRYEVKRLRQNGQLSKIFGAANG